MIWMESWTSWNRREALSIRNVRITTTGDLGGLSIRRGTGSSFGSRRNKSGPSGSYFYRRNHSGRQGGLDCPRCPFLLSAISGCGRHRQECLCYLLVAQGYEGVDAGGAAGWDPAGDYACGEQKGYCAG